jgi:heptosyltransferase-2
MKDSLKANVQALSDWRQQNPSHQHALLMPDSFSSALTFRLAGFKSVGWRDDGRSLLLKWPQTKPTEKLHAAHAWFELTKRALQCWGYDTSQATLKDSCALPITNEHKQAAAAALRVSIAKELSISRFVRVAEGRPIFRLVRAPSPPPTILQIATMP